MIMLRRRGRNQRTCATKVVVGWGGRKNTHQRASVRLSRAMRGGPMVSQHSREISWNFSHLESSGEFEISYWGSIWFMCSEFVAIISVELFDFELEDEWLKSWVGNSPNGSLRYNIDQESSTRRKRNWIEARRFPWYFSMVMAWFRTEASTLKNMYLQSRCRGKHACVVLRLPSSYSKLAHRKSTSLPA